jgi:hypothetical protein
MAVIKKIGSVVLGLAVLIGCIGKFKPSIFFDLPFPLSVILWMTTGHAMPPCEYNSSSLEFAYCYWSAYN